MRENQIKQKKIGREKEKEREGEDETGRRERMREVGEPLATDYDTDI